MLRGRALLGHAFELVEDEHEHLVALLRPTYELLGYVVSIRHVLECSPQRALRRAAIGVS